MECVQTWGSGFLAVATNVLQVLLMVPVVAVCHLMMRCKY
jgi:hypothetical protein